MSRCHCGGNVGSNKGLSLETGRCVWWAILRCKECGEELKARSKTNQYVAVNKVRIAWNKKHFPSLEQFIDEYLEKKS